MKIVCAWCQSEIHNDSQSLDSGISHGICPKCKEALGMSKGVELHSFLDTLDVPIVVVTEAGEICDANQSAVDVIGDDLDKFPKKDGGNVFGCAYAGLPQGCGNTVHCSGCTIRRTVMHTFETGVCHQHTPALLRKGKPDANQEINMLISTEKLKNVVLLRIDALLMD